MKFLKKYKYYESSEFVDSNYIDELLDKISDSGIESLSDIENNIFESVNKNDLTTFIFDFGIFITLNLSQVTKMGIDENATKELISMMRNLREPLINGKSYKELTTDINYLIQNPKLLSALLDQIRKLLIYIEPRIIKFVKEDEFKSNWLSKIKNFKDRYRIIIK